MSVLTHCDFDATQAQTFPHLVTELNQPSNAVHGPVLIRGTKHERKDLLARTERRTAIPC
jgi:hypothetical protein